MDSEQQQFDNPNVLASILRQKQLMSALGNGGLPQPMPTAPATAPSPALTNPDITVHHLVGTLPLTPQAQTAITGAAPNIPKVGPIDPNSTNPAESAYKQAIMNEPMHADYHPSTLRKVLSTVAGMGVGAFGGGAAGANLRQNLMNAPYNQQHNDWAQYAKNRGLLATEEASDTTTAGKAALTQAQTDEQNALAKLHQHETSTYHPTTAQEAIDQEQGKLKTDTREAKMMDGSTKHLVQRNGLFFDPETGARVDRSSIEDISDEGKSLKETRMARIPGNLGASIKAKQIVSAGVGGKTDDGQIIDQPTFDAAKQFDDSLSSGKEPAGAFARIIADRNKELIASGLKPLTSQDEEALQMKLLTAEKPPQTLLQTPQGDLIRGAPGVKPPPGTTTPQQAGANVAKDAAEQKSLKEDQDFVNDYLNNQTHTGPGDEALLERFFNVTKPSTGFRMNQAQIQLLTKLRSFTSAVKAHIAQLTGGTLFDDKQRKEIADTINQITSSKIKGGGPQADQLPGGISIQDIDAEIARRKGQK